MTPVRGVLRLALAAATVLTGCTGQSHPVGHAGASGASTGSAAVSGSVAASGSPAPAADSPKRSPAPGGLEAPTTSAVGVCKFAQPAQVAAAFGGVVSQVTAGTSGVGHPQCRFALSSSNLGLPGVVALSLDPGATAQFFDQARVGSGGELVGGIGDRAFWVTGQTELALLKGVAMLVIQATIKVPAAPQPQPAVVRADAISLGRVLAAQI